MAQVSPTQNNPGNEVTAASVNTPVNQLAEGINNIDNSQISASAAIATSKLASDGFLAAWSSWTPTFTNVSGGTVTYAKYIVVGKTVHFRLKYTLAGANISGSIVATLPVNLHANYGQNDTIGVSSFLDNGTNGYVGFLMVIDATSIQLRPQNSSATYATYTAGTSSTVPHTWASSDFFQCAGTYESA